MGHHKGCFRGVEAVGNRVPGVDRALPHVLNGFPFRHLNGFRSALPLLQQLTPFGFDFLLKLPFPEAMADLHQAPGHGHGHARVGAQDALRGLAGARHGAAVGPLQRNVLEETSCGFRLSMAVLIEGDVDLTLEATLAIPVGFPVAHQHQSGTLTFLRQGLPQMRGVVQTLDLHLLASTTLGAQVEHRQGGVVDLQSAEALFWLTEKHQHQAAEDGVVADHQHRVIAVNAVALQQTAQKLSGLHHEFWKRSIATAVLPGQFQLFRTLLPSLESVGVLGGALIGAHAAPGLQIDFQQSVVHHWIQVSTPGLQQALTRGGCPAQR